MVYIAATVFAHSINKGNVQSMTQAAAKLPLLFRTLSHGARHTPGIERSISLLRKQIEAGSKARQEIPGERLSSSGASLPATDQQGKSGLDLWESDSEILNLHNTQDTQHMQDSVDETASMAFWQSLFTGQTQNGEAVDSDEQWKQWLTDATTASNLDGTTIQEYPGGVETPDSTVRQDDVLRYPPFSDDSLVAPFDFFSTPVRFLCKARIQIHTAADASLTQTDVSVHLASE